MGLVNVFVSHSHIHFREYWLYMTCVTSFLMSYRCCITTNAVTFAWLTQKWTI